MAVTGLNNLILVAADAATAERLEAFYTAALGLPVAFRDGEKWVQLKGAAKLALASPEEAGAETPGAIPVFEVADLEQARAAVLAAGGSVVVQRDMGAHGSTLCLRDPVGNLLHLFKR